MRPVGAEGNIRVITLMDSLELVRIYGEGKVAGGGRKMLLAGEGCW